MSKSLVSCLQTSRALKYWLLEELAMSSEDTKEVGAGGLNFLNDKDGCPQKFFLYHLVAEVNPKSESHDSNLIFQCNQAHSRILLTEQSILQAGACKNPYLMFLCL